jgi:molybdenum-dependent DNA-binding transcriptional regulator ModE
MCYRIVKFYFQSRLLQQYREMEDQMQKAIRASLESEQQAMRHRLGPILGYNPEGH